MAFIFFAQKITKKYILPHKNPIRTPTNTPNDKINKTTIKNHTKPPHNFFIFTFLKPNFLPP